MLDVSSASGTDEDGSDLAIFADRLAAAGPDTAGTAALKQVRARIEAGSPPPGLRRLAELLAESLAERPPAQRLPAEDVTSVVEAVRESSLVVLEDFDQAATVAALAALVTDGRRVVVTGAAAKSLGTLRKALPAEIAGRVLDKLPAMPPAELRELRRLLATASPETARAGQQLPPVEVLPPVAVVAELCGRAVHVDDGAPGVAMVPGLLDNLDRSRREAVTSVARCVDSTLAGMPPPEQAPWAWGLLSHLIYGRHRAEFDRLHEQIAQAVDAFDRSRDEPPVSFTELPPPTTVDTLRAYQMFLHDGGRNRTYFRSAAQRDAGPVLQIARIGDRVPESEADVGRLLAHLELDERRQRIAATCAEVGVPVPRDEQGLATLADVLGRVAASARSVGAFRHDVLFIAQDSPLAVPDVDAAQRVAAAILEYEATGVSPDASVRLEELAGELADRCPTDAMSPEHELAVEALRAHDAGAYEVAFDALRAAGRELDGEARRKALLATLGDSTPELAAAWAAGGPDGFVAFLATPRLLTALPEVDAADVVVVLGAAGLGVERLLLTAVAPRLVAVIRPGEKHQESPSLLSVMQRAAALVISGNATTSGNVVTMPKGKSLTAAPARVRGA